MYVFDVSAEHNVSAAGTVAVEDTEVFYKFACARLGNDTLCTHTPHACISEATRVTEPQTSRDSKLQQSF